MKKQLIILSCLFFISASCWAQDAKDIIRKSEDKQRGNNSYVEMKMTIVRPTWKREMSMKSWSLGSDYSLMLITEPARDKGIAYLKRSRDLWNWQPSIDRVVKMPPSMMTQSWMGSDFTNDDLVKQSSIVDDYSHKLLGSETIEGRDCHKIEMIPKPNAAVVWGKVIVWVDKKEYLQLKSQFYDEDNYLVNTMLGKNIQSLGGRSIPTRMELIPENEKGNKTIMEYISADFNKGLTEDFFSQQNMKRIR